MNRPNRSSLVWNGSIALALSTSIALATIVAATTLFSEDWDSYSVYGTDFCTLNPGTGWTCVDSVAINEFRELNQLDIPTGNDGLYMAVTTPNGNPLVANTAPNMYRTVTAPTTSYHAMAEWEGGNRAQTATDGNFVILKLEDANGTRILDFGFRDADRYVDVTDGSSWVETNCQAPQAFRNYTAEVDVAAKTWALKIWDGTTLECQKTGLSVLSASDAKPTVLRIGSLSVNDSLSGKWDVIRLVT